MKMISNGGICYIDTSTFKSLRRKRFLLAQNDVAIKDISLESYVRSDDNGVVCLKSKIDSFSKIIIKKLEEHGVLLNNKSNEKFKQFFNNSNINNILDNFFIQFKEQIVVPTRLLKQNSDIYFNLNNPFIVAPKQYLDYILKGVSSQAHEPITINNGLSLEKLVLLRKSYESIEVVRKNCSSELDKYNKDMAQLKFSIEKCYSDIKAYNQTIEKNNQLVEDYKKILSENPKHILKENPADAEICKDILNLCGIISKDKQNISVAEEKIKKYEKQIKKIETKINNLESNLRKIKVFDVSKYFSNVTDISGLEHKINDFIDTSHGILKLSGKDLPSVNYSDITDLFNRVHIRVLQNKESLLPQGLLRKISYGVIGVSIPLLFYFSSDLINTIKPAKRIKPPNGLRISNSSNPYRTPSFYAGLQLPLPPFTEINYTFASTPETRFNFGFKDIKKEMFNRLLYKYMRSISLPIGDILPNSLYILTQKDAKNRIIGRSRAVSDKKGVTFAYLAYNLVEDEKEKGVFRSYLDIEDFGTSIDISRVPINKLYATSNSEQITIDGINITDRGGCKTETADNIIEYILSNTSSTYGSTGRHTLRYTKYDFTIQVDYTLSSSSNAMRVKVKNNMIFFDNTDSILLTFSIYDINNLCKIVPNNMKSWRLKISPNGTNWTEVLNGKRDHIEPTSKHYDVSNKPEGSYYIVFEGWDKANNYAIHAQKIFISRSKPIPPQNLRIANQDKMLNLF
jgi:tetratricopeptide (TPR) repeat protein